MSKDANTKSDHRAEGVAVAPLVTLATDPWQAEEAAFGIAPIEPVVEIPPEVAEDLLSGDVHAVSMLDDPRAPGKLADGEELPAPEAIEAVIARKAGAPDVD